MLSIGRSPSGDPLTKAPAAGIRVLIVEDDEDSAEALAYALARAGYVTAQASSAAAALRLVDGPSGPPAVIVLDLNLSDLGGPALAEDIRSAAAALGAVAALRKPFSVDSLLASLATAPSAPAPAAAAIRGDGG